MGKIAKGKEHELVDFIKTLLKKYPPSSDKNIKIAFQELVGRYSEALLFHQWMSIYKEGKSAKEIAKDILNAPKIRVYNSDNMGKGGHRGPSKRWQKIIEAERILFSPQEVLKKFRSELDPYYFLILLKPSFKEIPACFNNRTVNAFKYSHEVLISVLKEFMKRYNPRDTKHQQVMDIVDEVYKPKTKGKKVSRGSFEKAVKEFRSYIYGRSKNKDYTTKGFYYIAWLASEIEKVLGIRDELLKKRCIKEVKVILEKLPYDSQKRKVLETVLSSYPHYPGLLGEM